ncbi:bombesin receptor subtype-3-like [Anneissia japonica]|uniref:bombesin receptor subtype-3-like n=1 Tax=Anneissia japonica TaxID=1529436 RepID=UPI001425B7D6|nr:bombesin receptor subtype-3-like [Anneissia japonica]
MATTVAYTQTQEFEETSSTVDWVIVLEVVLGVIGTVGNSVICAVIIRVKSMHSLTNYLILSLAIADLLSSILLIVNVFPVEAAYLDVPDSAILAELFCRFYNNLFFFWVCLTASVFNLVCVTIERFFALVFPLYYERHFTSGKVWVMIAGTWVVSFIQEFAAPFVNSYDSDIHQCTYGFPDTASQRLNGVLIFLISYLIPLIFMIYSYNRILQNLKIDAGKQSPMNAAQAMTLLNARKRVISVLLIVLGAFCVLWTPNQVVYLFQNFDIELVAVSSVWYKVFRLMAQSNSVVNSFIYGYKYKKFRKAVRLLFGRYFCSNEVGLDDIGTTGSF